ncbi:MAG: methyltransferase [Nocardioides sp.]
MSGELPARLRDALTAAAFTYDAVADLLGPRAYAALERNETTPGLRRTTDGSALATLVRLFLLQVEVPGADADRALPGLVPDLVEEEVLVRRGDAMAARLDVRPYSADGLDLWVVSDLTPGLDGAANRVAADHVLGISSASTSLAQLTVRHPVVSALDLGTGCGVQALHLSTHSARVVATDVNERALWVTRFNAALNGVPDGVIEVRDGSLFDPVGDETFDLIATNPPFVISPATDAPLVYRDSGLPGDRVVEDLVRAAPAHLDPGGWCQVLANWVIEHDRTWDERLAGWLDQTCDALVVQREVLDPAAYVALWLKDSGHYGGPEHAERYDRWLAWFDEQGIEGVGFGWINLRRLATDRAPVHELLAWPYDVEQPIAPAVAAWAVAVDLLAAEPDLTPLHLVAAADLVQETQGPPGAEDPSTIVLRLQRGLRRARRADTVVAALVGACDGDLSVGQILDALAQLLDRDPSVLREDYLPVVRELVAQGFLAPTVD